MIKTTMQIIKKTMEEVNAEFYAEIEYCGFNTIDIRIYDIDTTPVILKHLLETGVIVDDEYELSDPHEDEVKYGFSGHNFKRVIVEIPEDLVDRDLDHLLQVGENDEY